MKERAADIVTYVLLFIWTAFTVFPFIQLTLTAFTGRTFITSLRPEYFTLSNFDEVIRFAGYSYVNSLITALGAMIINVPISSLAAYAFSRFNFYGKKLLQNFLFVVFATPLVTAFIPLFILFRSLRLINTLMCLILIGATTPIPLNVWFAQRYFDTIPRELEEAAMIDGCSAFRSFIKITLPLATPALVTMSLISFLITWNEFLLAVILISSPRNFTFTAALTGLGATYYGGFRYGILAAGSLLGLIPLIIFFALFRKMLVRGLTQGAIKG
ncbi:MAG: carbohydrate ABC transporter permease [Candidatus Bathyarchaeia archaeon]